jgi:hypothetical protein
MGFGALAGFYYTKRISCTHLKQKKKQLLSAKCIHIQENYDKALRASDQ